ncbi:HutD/Ves family protein [Nitratireductor aquibiodomus]|uniref:HutD/Ves family protein n=1 Tax=Nitratireductor aquibiodomus TaxID=204799 RepID=UPI00046A2C7B|nr:HutD family protein [Nitratireductor aquibiodomus]
MSRIHREVERRFTPWKNGGGETAEIICVPSGAGFDDFDWRISTAKVSQSGPFSRFPGIVRVLTAIEGGAIRLHFDDGRIIDARPGNGPHAFPGDDACVAELLGESLLDLNLMVRTPLQGAVLQGGETVETDDQLASYLFALKPLPALGLATYDLLELPALVNYVVPRDALVLTVKRPG